MTALLAAALAVLFIAFLIVAMRSAYYAGHAELDTRASIRKENLRTIQRTWFR